MPYMVSPNFNLSLWKIYSDSYRSVNDFNLNDIFLNILTIAILILILITNNNAVSYFY